MANEHEIAPIEPVEAEAEAAPEETPLSQPESESGEGTEEAPHHEPFAPAASETESEAGCPIEMGLDSGPKCGRKLHAAPDGVDKQPVCLMHSKDPNKQSGQLFDAFWLEFERTLEEAEENEAHFEGFVFPRANFSERRFKAICRFDDATFTQNPHFFGATFTQSDFHRERRLPQCEFHSDRKLQ
jgi:hypothetical protein